MSKEEAIATLYPSASDRVGRPWISKSDFVELVETIYDDMAPASAFAADSLLFGDTTATVQTLSVAPSTLVGRGATGSVAALTGDQARTVLGLAATDSPTFAGGAIGAANPTGATLGPELGTGVGLTQTLTGLAVGTSYYVAPLTGTLGTVTLDGSTVISYPTGNTAASFKATSTSHTVANTGGTATDLSVQAVTPVVPNVAVGGAHVQLFGNVPPAHDGQAASQTMAVGSRSFNRHVVITAKSVRNVAFGGRALESLVTGFSNSAFGSSTLMYLVSGESNSAVAGSALASLRYGNYNIANGGSSLQSLVTGNGNSALGRQSGQARTSGNYNTDIGFAAGFTGTGATLSGSVTIGTDSLGIGAAATADNTIALGTPLHTMKCGAVGTDSGLWAFGVRKAGAVTLDDTQYLTVKVDGQTYKLALAV